MKQRSVSAPMGAAWCRGASGGRVTADGNAASATDLLRQPATVTHGLGARFLAHRERRTGQQGGSAGGLPRRARPQRPCWLAACPRITRPLWPHFPQLRNRCNDSTYPGGCWSIKSGKAHKGYWVWGSKQALEK